MLIGVLAFLRSEYNKSTETLDIAKESRKTITELQQKQEALKVRLDSRLDEIIQRQMKLKTELETICDYNNKIVDQMKIIRVRQRALKEKMIPLKIELGFPEKQSTKIASFHAKGKKEFKQKLTDLATQLKGFERGTN